MQQNDCLQAGTASAGLLPRISRVRALNMLAVLTGLWMVLQTAAASAELTTETWIVTFDGPPVAEDLEVLQGVAEGVHGFEHLPAAVVTLDVLNVSMLDQLPGVLARYPNETYQFLLRESTASIRVDQAWSSGWTGAGVGVAIVDAGVDGTHPDLCAEPDYCLGNPVKTVQNVKIIGRESRAEPVVILEDQLTTDTGSGHGTHVAGIAAGAGVAGSIEPDRYMGVAPDAAIIGLGVGDVVEAVNVLAAFDWILAHQDQYNILVVNNSWGPGKGTPYDPEHPVNVASNLLRDAGISVAFGAGNDGPVSDTLNAFSAHPPNLSVAGGNKDGHIAFFSSRGVPGSDLWRPDLTAPGYQIVAARSSTGFYGAVADGTSANFSIDAEDQDRYATSSGTSMASPHVAGAVAVVQQAAMDGLGRYLTPEEVHNLLLNTSQHGGNGSVSGMPNYQPYSQGAGYLDVAAAAAAAHTGLQLTPHDDGLVHDSKTFAGQVGPALVFNTQSFDTTMDVQPGATSLNIMVDWAIAANDIDLDLYRPDGTLQRSTFMLCGGAAGEPNGYSSFCTNIANERLTVTNPVAGTWRATVKGGLAQTVEDVVGAWSVTYPDGTDPVSAQAVASIRITPDPATALQLTGSDMGLSVNVQDASGTPIAGAPLTWETTGVGELSFGESESHLAGWALGNARSSRPGEQVVTVSSGTASASIVLTWAGVELPDLGNGSEPPPEPSSGEAAGGGWVSVAGTRASFGFFGEYAEGDEMPHGELSWNDKAGTKAHADHVTAFNVNGTEATLSGPAEVNGEAGWHYSLSVDDQGEPGKDADRFHLVLTDPNGQIAQEVDAVIGGGNIDVSGP